MADGQALGLAAGVAETTGEGEHFGLGAGEDDRVRAVDGGEGHALRQQRGDLVLRRPHGDHRAAGGQFAHQPGAGRDQRAGVVEGEDARHVRGRDLADRVTGHELRVHAPRLDEPVQGDLQREQGGLGVAGGVEEFGLGRAAAGEDDVPQRVFELAVEPFQYGVQGPGENGEPGVELPAHAGALRALAREQHGERALDGTAACDLGRHPVHTRQEHRPVLEHGAARREGEAHVQGRGVRQPGDPGELFRQRLLGPARDRPRHDGRGGFGGAGSGGVLGHRAGLLQHDVGVGAADPEGGDAGAARAAGLRPQGGLGEEADGPGGPVDVARGPVGVQGAGQLAVAHGHDRLDDARDSGGGLRVPDVRLDGAEHQRLSGVAVPAVGGEDGLGLDGVAEGGAGAVGLDGVDVGGGQPGGVQGALDDAPLGGAVGGGEAVGGAVLVDGGAADDGEDGVAVAAGVGQALQQQHADALGPAGAVGVVGEGLAAAVAGQAALPAELHEGAGCGHHVDAAGQGEGALPGAQGVGGRVQGDEGGGAGGVDGDRGPLQAEGVGQAAGGGAGRDAGADVAGGVGQGTHQQVGVVLAVGADVDAGGAAAQAARVDAGAFQGLPGGFQEQSLLGVHRHGLTGRDAEEGGVEVGGPVEESALLADGVAAGVDAGVAQGVQVPAAVGGEAADGVGAGGDELPQVFRGADAAGVAAAHGDDGDGFGGSLGQFPVLPAQALGLLEGGPESFDDFFAGRGHDLSVSPAVRQGCR